MRRVISVFVFLLTLVAQPGCAALQQALPAVVKVFGYIQDAEQGLGLVESGAKAFFADKPSTDEQKRLEQAFANARSALNAAQRIANAGDTFDQKNSDVAFADFRKAWGDVVDILVSLGALALDDSLTAGRSSSAVWVFPTEPSNRIYTPQVVNLR